MNILDTIIASKRKEVEARKAIAPIFSLMKEPFFQRECISMKDSITKDGALGIIAEFKRKSPSKSWINQNANVEEVTKVYATNGASGISVLTDQEFFGADNNDFKSARYSVSIPLLRKDFIIDEYQIVESKAMGADVILLIAKVLKPAEIERLTDYAHSIGLEVLLELQDEEEVRLNAESKADLFGINNRNLKDFSVDFENSIQLASMLPADKIKIAESGIESIKEIEYLKEKGFHGFLMGTQFMKHEHPGEAFKEFIEDLNKNQVDKKI